ncbi:UNVERIFIED_CONTAM: hypothetical protein K2H54_061200 [Gekko kuhli]
MESPLRVLTAESLAQDERRRNTNYYGGWDPHHHSGDHNAGHHGTGNYGSDHNDRFDSSHEFQHVNRGRDFGDDLAESLGAIAV